MRKKIPFEADEFTHKESLKEPVVSIVRLHGKMKFCGTLGGMFRHGLSKHGERWAYPSTEVLSCFKMAMLPIKPEVIEFVECLQQVRSKCQKSRRAEQKNQILDDALLDLLNATGSDRTKKAKRLKSTFAKAIDVLSADTVKSRHRSRKLISVERNIFPPSLLRYEKLSDIAASEMFDQISKRAKAQKKLNVKLKSDSSIIQVPIACVAIEYARRHVQKSSTLPTKLELRKEITKYHEKETLDLDNSTWTKVWKEAGLNDLTRCEKT